MSYDLFHQTTSATTARTSIVSKEYREDLEALKEPLIDLGPSQIDHLLL